jgi:excisionase family DNA binding protein
MIKNQFPQRGSPSYVEMQKLLAGKEFLNTKEAACYLGISINTLYKLTQARTFPVFKLGNKIITLKREDLDDWRESKKCIGTRSISQKLNKYFLKN